MSNKILFLACVACTCEENIWLLDFLDNDLLGRKKGLISM